MRNNFTVVTGFFDLNRAGWKTKHSRSNDDYFRYISNMLGMDVKIVIFVEPKNMYRFSQFRKGKKEKTFLVPYEFKDLEMFPYIHKMRECQTDEKVMRNHPDPSCPEYRLPEYNTLVNSKFALVKKACELNPFQTDYFCWIDAGYTHCTKNLKDKKYDPTLLYDFKDRLTISQLTPIECMKNDYHDFFIQHIDVISAGFFWGERKFLSRFSDIYSSFYKEILFKKGISDDEQYYLALLLRERPDLFNPIFMGWFGSLEIR